MTFTYSGDPSTSTRNYVRFLIHDTDSTDALFSDEELNYVITEWGSDAYSAARELAESLLRRQMRKSPPRPFANAQALKSTNDRIVDDYNTDAYTGIHDNPNNVYDRRIVE